MECKGTKSEHFSSRQSAADLSHLIGFFDSFGAGKLQATLKLWSGGWCLDYAGLIDRWIAPLIHWSKDRSIYRSSGRRIDRSIDLLFDGSTDVRNYLALYLSFHINGSSCRWNKVVGILEVVSVKTKPCAVIRFTSSNTCLLPVKDITSFASIYYMLRLLKINKGIWVSPHLNQDTELDYTRFK